MGPKGLLDRFGEGLGRIWARFGEGLGTVLGGISEDLIVFVQVVGRFWGHLEKCGPAAAKLINLASGRVEKDRNCETSYPRKPGRGLPLPYLSPWPGADHSLPGQLMLFSFAAPVFLLSSHLSSQSSQSYPF